MNKKMQDLLENIRNKKEEARNLIENKKLTEAEALIGEVKNLQKEFDLESELLEDNKLRIASNPKPLQNNPQKTATTEFFNTLKPSVKVDNAMVSKDKESGGYTVPEDVRTKINKLKEAKGSFIPHIKVTPVSTESGADTYQKRSSTKKRRMRKVDQMGKIEHGETPEFTRLEWKVQKYADTYPASNELLSDSDANIERVMVEWIYEVLRVTENEEVLEILNDQKKFPIADSDAFKKMINVELDQAFRGTSKVFTNQNGFHVIDTWKYEDGRYMLQENATVDSGFTFAGRELVVFSNNDWAHLQEGEKEVSDASKAPLVIGDLKEGVEKKDRMALAVRSSDIAGSAWETDSTEWRAIDRFDTILRDDKAFVFGELDIKDANPRANKSSSAK